MDILTKVLSNEVKKHNVSLTQKEFRQEEFRIRSIANKMKKEGEDQDTIDRAIEFILKTMNSIVTN